MKRVRNENADLRAEVERLREAIREWLAAGDAAADDFSVATNARLDAAIANLRALSDSPPSDITSLPSDTGPK